MKAPLKIGWFIPILVVLGACGRSPENHFPEEGIIAHDDKNEYTQLVQHEVLYAGGKILLENVVTPEGSFQIQEISHNRQDVKFRAKRVPNAVYLSQKGLTAKALEEALLETEGEQLFYFEFEEEQKQDLLKKYWDADLDKAVSYLSFDIAQDFELVTSKGEKIPCNYTIYERNFHVAPFERILISFNGITPQEEIKLVYKDALFGKGTLSFMFASADYIENNTKNPS